MHPSSALLPVSILLLGLAPGLRAEIGAHNPFTGAVSHEFGSIVKGVAEAETLSGTWVQRSGAWLEYQTPWEDRLQLKAGVGGVYWYSLPEYAGVTQHQTRYFAPGLTAAYGTYRFGDSESGWKLSAGYFPFKYNPDAANLGEYLFRTGVYPGYIHTGGMAIAKSSSAHLVGLNLSGGTGPLFGHDLILNSSNTLFPLYDFSLSYLLSMRPIMGFELGAGIQFDHLIAIKPSRTTPKSAANAYFSSGGRAYYADPQYYKIIKDTAAARFVEEVTNTDTLDDGTPVVPAGQRPVYSHYTFKGTKLMARAAFDPKALFGRGPLGPRDLRLYFEAALLGVKDYPVFYENRLKRIPMLVGFNLPAFGLLDVAALEVERYTSDYVNSYYMVYEQNAPIPHVPGNYNPAESAEDDIKWSFNAEREFRKGFSIVGQVARDHLRTILWPGRSDPQEALTRPGHWYYAIKLVLKR